MTAETYKRDLVRQWCALCSTPFVETLNTAPPASLAEPWFTIEFDVEASERLTFAGAMLERGLLDLIFAGAPGDGDAAILAAAQADALTIFAQADPQRMLTLERINPPHEASNGSADHSYRVMIGIEYTYRYQPF
jgi:hypothetical protein